MATGEEPGAAAPKLPVGNGLTQYVADFVVKAKYENLPAEVIELAKKSILDGFGSALAGSVSEHRHAVLEYVKGLEQAKDMTRLTAALTV